MIDVTPLTNWLATLGPWGYLVSAVVVVAVYYLRLRMANPAPVTPTPTPTPAVSSPRLDALAPLLNALLKVLGLTPADRPATVADLPHDKFLQLQAEMEAVNAAKVAAHSAALADLAPTPVAATTK